MGEENVMTDWKKTWNYDEEVRSGANGYVIRSGDRIIGRIGNQGDADLICRARRESMRQASQIAFDTRQHSMKVQNLRRDIRLLMDTLNHLADALKETARRRDVTAAREKATKILRIMKAHGHTI